MPMRMTLSTRNLLAVVRNLFAAEKDLVFASQVAVQDAAERVYQRAYDLAPKRTYFMVEHLRMETSPDALTFEVGYREQDFTGAGFAFYPVFVEFGTTRMAAQPHLFPASEEVRPHFQRTMQRLVREAINRRSRAA
jgi:HK97 gp10 family phage protein